MFVVGNPLERGNTRVHAHIHTPIYTHTHRCKNIESIDTSKRIKTCFV